LVVAAVEVAVVAAATTVARYFHGHAAAATPTVNGTG